MYLPKGYYMVSKYDLNEIKQSLLEGVPIIFGMHIYDIFYSVCEDGIISPKRANDAYRGGHCMVILGHDDDKQAFKVRNSWGTGKGNDGYYWLPYSMMAEYCFDLYCYFFERGKNILKLNGKLSFITPSLFIKGVKYSSLQDYLIKNVDKLIIEDKGDNIFEGVSMPTAITFFENNINYNSLEWSDIFLNNPITQKIKFENTLLGDLSKIQRGLEIGKDKTSKEVDKHELVTGEDIEKYNVKNIRYINDITYNEFIKGDIDFFTKDRVLIRETGSKITCVYLDKFILSTRSLYSIIPVDSLDSKYLIAILCSKLIQYFYEVEFKADTDVFPKIRISQVKKIPIKVCNNQQPFIDKVDQILTLKKDNPAADTSVLEREIDVMVYALYGLTEEEIEIVENN
jgi:hypothetical protein